MKVLVLLLLHLSLYNLSNSYPTIAEEDELYSSPEAYDDDDDGLENEKRDFQTNSNQFECVIMNDYYKNEYLYSASSLHKVTFFMRYVFTWSPLIKVLFGSKRPNVFSDVDKQGVWVLEPVPGKENTFFIKNFKYGEYLYAQDALIGQSLSDRRRVLTWKSSKNDMDFKEYYMWSFERTNDGTFYIRNVAYNEALFAASHFYRKDTFRRSVFTWKHPPNSRQFNWNVKCRNDVEPFTAPNIYY